MLNYEKPELIDLTYDFRTAQGATCNYGSRNSGKCQAGMLATTTCQSTGTTPGGSCSTGSGGV